ncbi:MAG: HD-GYP domain-containing protein [Phycisphaerales bacterium]|nr:MAG: HD-GYP domain-containing protein [Phycisphaerales bacterium]
MSGAAENLFDTGALHVVRERCAALGAMTAVVDGCGMVIDPPLDDDTRVRWITAPAISGALADIAARWATQTEPAPAEVVPGVWVSAHPISHRRRRSGYLLAFQIMADALRGDSFAALCRDASVEVDEALAALTPIARHTRECVDAMPALLRWLYEDQEKISSQNLAVEGFSKQLTESYEEINLLYKLGRSMNELVQPENYVRLVLEELHATLSFRIIAAAFVDDRAAAGSIAGRFLQVGAEDSESAWLQRSARNVLGTIDTENTAVLELPRNGDPVRRSVVANALALPVSRDARLLGVILVADKQGDDPDVSSVDIKLVAAAAGYMSILLDNSTLYEDQQSMFLGTLKALTASIDAKDRYTRGHSERVAHLTKQLARRAGMSDETLERYHIAGLVHDVGKIGVPESVLRKPGRLTDDEFEWIKRHPEIGHRILRDIPQLSDVLPGVLYHHERWDGGGYPHGLRGEDIPMVARVMAIADSFDAMSSTRTYRPAMPRDRVLAEIRNCAGSQFDPALASLFVELDFSAYDRMVRKHMTLETRDYTTREPGEGAAA